MVSKLECQQDVDNHDEVGGSLLVLVLLTHFFCRQEIFATTHCFERGHLL